MIAIDICLSDLPKNKITEGKNGKKYIKLILAERKEPGKYGETHFLAVSKTKEEREAQADTIYVGSGKTIDTKQPQKPTTKQPEPDEKDDLPF